MQDVPPTAQARLRGDPGIRLVKITFYWLNIAFPNWSAPPTDKLAFRQAVQAALDFDEIMDAASDGAFSPVKALQIPGSLDDSEAGAGFGVLRRDRPLRRHRRMFQSCRSGQG